MKVYCILSDERAYRSRSPTIFSTVLNRAGIKGAYVPFMVAPEDLGRAIQSLRVLNIAGANVTVPYKESVIPYLDVLSEGANIIGAINTIVCSRDTLKGYNTNAIGFMDALQHADFDVTGSRALVFGTGGAAKAVVFILNWLRSEAVYVVGRHEGRTSGIVEQFGGEATAMDRLAEEAIRADILVNATSASSPDEAPKLAELVSQLSVPGCRLMLDLNYGREENFWREWANRHRVDFMDGLLPLAYQARRTFALWTGMQVPPEEFIDALGNGK
ncbi:Shikimate 5-dehydrogenase I alpha (EC [Olavius algarvensis associated proteobacterium Delta 3]|nr:Shikimate 5-dehydrogenase I alpha (EC [Olavius algarvensis associated proteobacterium Delta 3]CAB5165646.1 Shikimate 5-dehydrogenase I alpha (EC [Olavius algarvensis associated proteobacterium Delta 3]